MGSKKIAYVEFGKSNYYRVIGEDGKSIGGKLRNCEKGTVCLGYTSDTYTLRHPNGFVEVCDADGRRIKSYQE